MFQATLIKQESQSCRLRLFGVCHKKPHTSQQHNIWEAKTSTSRLDLEEKLSENPPGLTSPSPGREVRISQEALTTLYREFPSYYITIQLQHCSKLLLNLSSKVGSHCY